MCYPHIKKPIHFCFELKQGQHLFINLWNYTNLKFKPPSILALFVVKPTARLLTLRKVSNNLILKIARSAAGRMSLLYITMNGKSATVFVQNFRSRVQQKNYKTGKWKRNQF